MIPKSLDASNRLREQKEGKTKLVSTSENQSSSAKKNLRAKTGISPRVQSRSTSPVRQAGAPKIQPGEPVKRRATTRSPVQNAAKRTMETHAAANSKLPFDLNSAAYFICKLQDEGNNHQYLLVVPKKPIETPDGHRKAPGQESVKQLHCPRQCSGFQSLSWDDSATATRSQPPLESQASGGLSILGSFRIPPVLASTALGIIKDHLHRNTVLQNPDDREREAVYPPKRMRRILMTRPISRPRRPVLRPSHKANTPILQENRTLLLTNNPFHNLSFSDHNRDVIVLHPPDPGFRPSKNSFSKGEVEVQHITVPNEDTVVKPIPPTPPTKPKRTSVINP
ncbi:GD11178 [Drosophila simulans]|nr:GD11178 [Drosophila simulans]